jgi:hypothetical protein
MRRFLLGALAAVAVAVGLLLIWKVVLPFLGVTFSFLLPNFLG